MKFIGVDFGWTSQPSGVACLDEGLRLVGLDRIEEPQRVVDWIVEVCGEFGPAMVAVDAPTRITNASGMRLCEREAHRRFGRYDAGCYPSNLGSVFATRTTGFGDALERLGFAHAPRIKPCMPGRYQIECFPHIAAVQFFELERVIKYKKGLRVQRAAGLKRFRRLLLSRIPSLQAAAGLKLPAVPVTGGLKPVEDKLDAVLCAYAGAWWWRWGLERNDVLGDPEEGYIIAPKRIRPGR